jgi:hypothetical protein
MIFHVRQHCRPLDGGRARNVRSQLLHDAKARHWLIWHDPDRAHGEGGHRWPEALPGGHAVLYTVTTMTGGLDGTSIAALDLRSGRQTILMRGGSHAVYAPSGHLLYEAAGTLRAVGSTRGG